MFHVLLVLLAAIVIAVPLSRYAGLGSILGYLAAGVVIGPSVLGLVTNVSEIRDISEFGVTMLLFLIGLELRPHRLWILRKSIFGMGLGQMLPTACIIAAVLVLSNVPPHEAIVLGIGLSLSSTAITLPMLSERNLLATIPGRDAFAVLLFQDMAAIPVLALLPMLAGTGMASFSWLEVIRGIGAVAIILVGGSFLVPYALRIVARAKVPEVFSASALLLVVGTATLADWSGLSASLGAFLAGVVLSDSDYRHEIQADIKPFEGLLLGFFFISVGMATDLHFLLQNPVKILLYVIGVIVLKFAVAAAVSYARRRLPVAAIRFGLALPEGSEFGFVLFTAAIAEGTLNPHLAAEATLIIALSMLLSPILFSLSERHIIPRLSTQKSRPFDKIDTSDDDTPPVIICGFGRVGQITGRILAMQKIRFTALERSQSQIDIVRRFGSRVYYGDPLREDVMRAAGADKAKVLLLAIDNVSDSVQIADMLRQKFPHLHIVARARDRHHAHLLMGVGVRQFVRETFFSSLKLAELVLDDLNLPEEQAARAIRIFEARDELMLHESYAVANDERKMIQTVQETNRQLQDLFESDESDREE